MASTKAFTAQVIAQLLVGLQIGRARQLSVRDGKEIVRALEALPAQVQQILDRREDIRKLAQKYANAQHIMYLGRDALYPVALEGALKLKEISYIDADAYPADEIAVWPVDKRVGNVNNKDPALIEPAAVA